MKTKYVKVVVFVPETHAQNVREALSANGCGRLGDYDSCSFSTAGVGRFRPLKAANPFVGKVGEIEEVTEERIEVLCEGKNIDAVVAAVKKVHPYENPAIEVYSLLYP